MGGCEVDAFGVVGGGVVGVAEELEETGGAGALGEALLDADGDELEGGVGAVGGVSPGVAGVGVVVCLALGFGELGLEGADAAVFGGEEGDGVGEGWVHGGNRLKVFRLKAEGWFGDGFGFFTADGREWFRKWGWRLMRQRAEPPDGG